MVMTKPNQAVFENVEVTVEGEAITFWLQGSKASRTTQGIDGIIYHTTDDDEAVGITFPTFASFQIEHLEGFLRPNNAEVQGHMAPRFVEITVIPEH